VEKKIEITRTINKPWKKIDKEALKGDIAEYPDAYSYERAKRFGVSIFTISYWLKKLGYSYKKKSSPMWKQTKIKEKNIKD
jgi:transposase